MFFLFSMSTGGAERFTANMANHWIKQGYQVSVVTLSGQGEDGYALDPRIDRVTLDLVDPRRSLWCALKNNFVRVQALNAILKKYSPDVVLGIMSTASILLSLAQKSRSRVHIGTERIYPPSLPLGRIWETLRKVLYGRLNLVVAQTEKGADWVRNNTNARRVETIPNPVTFPLALSSPYVEPTMLITSERKVLLSVGRLEPQKAHDRLISAFACIAYEFPDWDLVILGEGQERKSLEALIQKFGLDDRVFLPGRAGNAGDWYKRASLFALTSLFEGFPNVLAEAMAHGLPVVSFDCDTGPRDIIRSGQNGVIVPQGDIPGFSAALRSLMEDPEKRIALSMEALEVRETYSIKSVAARWHELVEPMSKFK